MAALGYSTRTTQAVAVSATAVALAVSSELPFSVFIPGGVTCSIDQTGLPGSVADLATAGHWESVAAAQAGPKLVTFNNPVTMLRLTATGAGTVYYLHGQPR